MFLTVTTHTDPDGRNHKKTAQGKASSGKQLLEDLSCFNCLPSRTADGKGKHTIPLYNILWAELRDDALIVDYAAPRKKSLKLQKWTFALPHLDAEAAGGGPSPETFVSALISAAYGESKPRKRAYVLINPNSGPGGATVKWRKSVKPVFDAARLELEVVNLSRGGEATELAEKADIDKYDTIMALSGDGTPYEIFNGLGRRPDAARALAKIAVSHIPCGSGNAFSLNCYGSNDAAVAALAVVKGVVMPLDLVSVTQGDRRILSFLSQTLGIIAESDLGTENLRWMGSTRFEVGLVTRVLKKKCYPFDLSIKLEIDGKEKIKQHYKKYALDSSLLNVDAEAEAAGGDAQGLPPLKYGTVQDEIPGDWETASHDNVGTFYVGNVSLKKKKQYILRNKVLWLTHWLTLLDGLHVGRRKLLLGRRAYRRPHGPGHDPGGHLAHGRHQGVSQRRDGQVLRQPQRDVQEDLGVPHHAAQPGDGLHQHRRRAHPL